MRNLADVESTLPIRSDLGRRNHPASAGGAISAAMTGWSWAEGVLPETAPISPGVRGRSTTEEQLSQCAADKPEARALHPFKAALMMTWMASRSVPYLTGGVGMTEHCVRASYLESDRSSRTGCAEFSDHVAQEFLYFSVGFGIPPCLGAVS